jgi:DNA-binding NarL/FixJ family response regulator
MDLQMPEMNGVDALIAIRTEFADAKMIVLTTYEGDVQILRALKAGAQGYLLKNTMHSELLQTIRAVHAGKRSLSPEVSFQVAEHMSDQTLTPAEVAVLRRRECEQADCRSAPRYRRHRQRARQEHSCETGRQ